MGALALMRLLKDGDSRPLEDLEGVTSERNQGRGAVS
jgi:hypothetical protein